MNLRSYARRIPVEVYALAAIALVTVVTHVPMIRDGMCFNDPSWLFHFGRKTLYGAVPYRDYVFQVGPLPVYIDAGFQELFGERYAASLFAALFVKILRVWIVWMIAERLASRRVAAALAVFCIVDPLFSFAHHWSTPYAELFITLGALLLIRGMRAVGRRSLAWFAGAGASMALVISARQSSWALITVVLLVSTIVLVARRDEQLTRRRMAALWIGFAAALVVFAALLALGGALGPAIQQMFLDAPQKKGIHGLDAALDAISGGALVDGRFVSRWRGFAYFIGVPIMTVAVATYLAAKEKVVASSTLALLAFPVLTAIGLLARDFSFEHTTDLPRTFLSVLAGLALFAPSRLRTWFGIEPLLVVGLGSVALASDWALEMSFPGRGWGDVWALVTAIVLLALASAHLTERVKLWLCAGLAVAGLAHAGVTLYHGIDPFAKFEATDGTLAQNDFAPHLRGKRSPLLRGIRLPQWRSAALEWLASTVTPRSTCFVYANLPSLYDLLDCANPTRIDTTIADFPSAEDAEAAISELTAHPPDIIIAHDRMWMSPAISVDLGGDLGRYDSWNPKASFVLHMGLRRLIDQYESLGTVGEAIGPAFAEQAAAHWDVIDALHVYRRKR